MKPNRAPARAREPPRRITGATGTGKTITLQVLAEGSSRIGVPGVHGRRQGRPHRHRARRASSAPKLKERLEADRRRCRPKCRRLCRSRSGTSSASRGIRCAPRSPTWGRCCSARLLNLNETQEGVLALAFKIADDNGLLLLDLKDLRALLQFVGDNAAQFKTQYGNISAASIGAIQRGLLQLEQQGGDRFFGEPMLDIDDLMQTDASGRGVVNVLAADKLMQRPRLYSTFLLWLLAELFENAARGRRPRQAEARVLLRRGASAVQRGAAGADREDRAGRAADPLARASASISSRRIRSTFPTRCSASSATACSTRCARSRRATRRR